MGSFSRKINLLRKLQVIILTIIFVFSPLIPQREAMAVGGYKVPHIIGYAGTLSSGSYLPAVMARGSSTTEANVQFYATKDGTFSGLSILVYGANASGDSTVVFRKNGADGNQTVTVPQSSTGLYQDTTNSDSVVVGDLINLYFTTTAGTLDVASLNILFEADDGSTTQFIMSSSEPAGFGNNNTTRYFNLASSIATDLTTESPAQNIIQHGAVASDFAVYIESNTRTTTTTFRVRKNATNGSQISVNSGVSGLRRNTTTTDTIAAGDFVNFSMGTFGSGNLINIRNFQLTLTSDNPRELTIMGGPTFTRTFTTSPFFGRIASGLGSPATTVTFPINQSVLGVAGVLSGMAINVGANTWTREYNVFLNNGGNVNQNVNVPLTTTGWFQDTTNTDTVTATDLLLFRALVGTGSGGAGSTNIRGISFLVTLPETAIEQSAYRFFENDDSTDVGPALNTQDTPATLGSSGDAFRLRLVLHVLNAQLGVSGENFKLQFAEKSGTCDTAFSGETYADVTGSTLIAYNNNATPADGDNLTSNMNDPAHGADTVTNQDYEELNNFTNSVSAIPDGQDGKWDFSLIDNGATANTSYCFRVVKSDGSTLDTYSTVPEIITAAGGGALSVDIVDAGATPVPTPSVAMSGINFSFTDQTSTGTFGISSEKIRVDNGTGSATWTLSLAADSGATAVWDGVSTDYDFNDPTASAGDGGDTDSLGGQMTLDPSSATITPEGGCTLTNISAGSSTAFSEGVTDSITLASATTGADTGCYWDITGIDIAQTIPAEQPADDYSIDMTLSIIAS